MRYRRSILVGLFAIAATPAPLDYKVDPAASAVTAKVGFLGIGSKTARFPAMSGSIVLQPDRPEAMALDVTLDARQLVAGDSVTTERLRGEKFFDVARYPEVQFSGRKLLMQGPTKALIDGTLTARGVSRPVRLDVSFDRPIAAATGRDAIALTATTIIDRRQFGMTAYSLVVGKKVAITIRARMVPR